jgi:hypothetical protein
LVGRTSGIKSAPKGLFRRVVARPDGRVHISSEISSLLPVDRAAEVAVVANYFAGDAAHRSAEAVEAVLPGTDVIVCDELDFGAMGVGARAGVPVVVVSVIASGALVRAERITDALENLRLKLGLARPIPYQGDLFVVPFAPNMRDPGFPAPANSVWMRPDRGHEPDPDGSIVATLGTEFNTESGDLFNRILAALAELDAPSVVAVGIAAILGFTITQHWMPIFDLRLAPVAVGIGVVLAMASSIIGAIRAARIRPAIALRD